MKPRTSVLLLLSFLPFIQQLYEVGIGVHHHQLLQTKSAAAGEKSPPTIKGKKGKGDRQLFNSSFGNYERHDQVIVGIVC